MWYTERKMTCSKRKAYENNSVTCHKVSIHLSKVYDVL